jgi:hypothetical protein
MSRRLIRDRPMQTSPSKGSEIILRHFRERLVDDGRPRHEHDIHRLSQTGLIHTKRFPKETARPAPHHGIADAPAGYHANPAARTRRQADPIQNQASTRETAPLIARSRKITTLFDTTLPGQSERRRRRGVHDRDPESNWSEALAAHPTAIPEDGAAALAGIAAEKAVLPFPADLRGLILSFHIKICPTRGSPGRNPSGSLSSVELSCATGGERVAVDRGVSSASPGQAVIP